MIDYSNIISNCYTEDLFDKYISQICNNEYMFFLSKTNVVGVGLGFKCTKNIYTTEKCIAVFVEKKIPKSSLTSFNIIPKFYKGIKTDVIDTGASIPFELTEKIRPVPPGYCVMNVNVLLIKGSIGCLVTDDTGSIYMLSNNHILANYNRSPIGSGIIQPFYGDPSKDVVANLYKFIPLNFITETSIPENFVDAAIAKAVNPDILSADIPFIGIPKGVIMPRIGYGVKKVGAFSELTSGLILYTNVTKTFDSLFEKYLMKNCIISTAMSYPGDSGSLLLDENNLAVGLLIGGNPKTGYSTYCPITTVLKALDVKLITS